VVLLHAFLRCGKSFRRSGLRKAQCREGRQHAGFVKRNRDWQRSLNFLVASVENALVSVLNQVPNGANILRHFWWPAIENISMHPLRRLSRAMKRGVKTYVKIHKAGPETATLFL
jgi:hypothetical protein